MSDLIQKSWLCGLETQSRYPTNSFGRRSSRAGATAAVTDLGSCSVIRRCPAGLGASLAGCPSQSWDRGPARESPTSRRYC